LHYQAENFREVIGKVWNTSEASIKQKKLQGELYIAPDFPRYVEIDSHRITQILLNLIGNATKFCKEGFVNVVVSWHSGYSKANLATPTQDFQSKNRLKTGFFSCPTDKEIDIGAYEFENTDKRHANMQDVLRRQFNFKSLGDISNLKGAASVDNPSTRNTSLGVFSPPLADSSGIIKIQVTDSGCGMSAKALDNLFQPFRQADSSITRKYGGTGLGLYIAKEIISKMRGEIHAYSKEGQGSTFVVLIPAQIAKKEDSYLPNSKENILEVDRTTTPKPLTPTRALVVDDLDTNQKILSSYLDKLNIYSDVAVNGAEALQMFKSKPHGYYSFITMDLQMPVMDGITASQEIRKYEAAIGTQTAVPIIVITGNCAETEKFKCLDPTGAVRAFNFFRKPFTFGECKSVVQAIFDEKFNRSKQSTL